MAENTADRARQLVDRLGNDAQFRESLEAAPTLHDKAEIVRAAGYGDVRLDAIQEAFKERATTLGTEELSDLELELVSGGGDYYIKDGKVYMDPKPEDVKAGGSSYLDW